MTLDEALAEAMRLIEDLSEQNEDVIVRRLTRRGATTAELDAAISMERALCAIGRRHAREWVRALWLTGSAVH